MSLLQSAAFLRCYGLLPHRLLNGAVAHMARARRPRWAVDTAIRLWIRRARIDMKDFEERSYVCVEDFFLRRLRPGARQLAEGFVSPVDGRVVGAGVIESDTVLHVKGRPISVARLVNGRRHDIPLRDYEGGMYAAIFLSPHGYHRVHMPVDGQLVGCYWVPGRYFPQNEAALRHISGVYERNERAVLRCRMDNGPEFLLVMIGASLVGSIFLEGMSRATWVRPEPVALSHRRVKGEEIGHFTFGSTVAVLVPRGSVRCLIPEVGADVHMGEALFELVGGPSG